MISDDRMLPPVRDWAAGNLERTNHPVRVLQFGEGNFLRAFADWMIDIMNEKGLFNGSVRIIQPRPGGSVAALNAQDGLYTVVGRGLRNGKPVSRRRIVTCIEKGIDPYSDFNGFMESARIEELRFVVSNTTEVGISYKAEDYSAHKAVLSFPGKVVQLLLERYRFFNGAPEKGLVFLPCELIENNGSSLKELVLRLSEEWGLPEGFRSWVSGHNIFTNTLVDRIVPGFPADEAADLFRSFGYTDSLLAACEDFHLWVIEGGKTIEHELPLAAAGLNVVWTDDLDSYRTRKVRILNGIHTMICPAAVLYGLKTVDECLVEPTVSLFISKGLETDILPSLSRLEDDPRRYAEDVLERFANPFIKHSLLSISLNSASKFTTRVLPGIIDVLAAQNRIPEYLAFSAASLIIFYNAEYTADGCFGSSGSGIYEIKDSRQVTDFFISVWAAYCGTPESAEQLSAAVFSNPELWGTDMTSFPGFISAVGKYLYMIRTAGMKSAMAALISNGG